MESVGLRARRLKREPYIEGYKLGTERRSARFGDADDLPGSQVLGDPLPKLLSTERILWNSQKACLTLDLPISKERDGADVLLDIFALFLVDEFVKPLVTTHDRETKNMKRKQGRNSRAQGSEMVWIVD